MALVLSTEYPAGTTIDLTNYPQGKAKNVSTPTGVDGFPWEQEYINDKAGFLQSLLFRGNVTPSGVADTVVNSDYMDALLRVVEPNQHYTDTGTVAGTYLLAGSTGAAIKAFRDGQTISFRALLGNTGPATAKLDALAAKPIVDNFGNALTGGEISPAFDTKLRYDVINDNFILLNGKDFKFYVDPTAADQGVATSGEQNCKRLR